MAPNLFDGLAIIDTLPAASPFLNSYRQAIVSRDHRNRSGHEQTLLALVNTLPSDADRNPYLDKDGSVSLLEAFLVGSRRTASFQCRRSLGHEHALLDDNGDGLGTPPIGFKGLRAIRKPKEDAALTACSRRSFNGSAARGQKTNCPQIAQRVAWSASLFIAKKRLFPKMNIIANWKSCC